MKSYDNTMTPPSSGWRPSGTTVATRPAPVSPPLGPPAATANRLPSAPRERKPALAALALLLIVAGVLASVYLQIQARNQVGVIEITKQVAQGQQITPRDTTEVMVAKNSNINYVLWSQENLLSKYSAAADLLPGTMLVGQMLTNQIAADPNQVLIPLVLKVGDYPSDIGVDQTLIAYYVPGPGASAANNSSSNSAGGSTAPTAGPVYSSVKIISLPGTESSEFAGSSSDDVFTVSVDKSAAAQLLQDSAAGTLVLVAPAAGN